MTDLKNVAKEAVECMGTLDSIEEVVDYLTGLLSDMKVEALQSVVRLGNGECIPMAPAVEMLDQECQAHMLEKERRLEFLEVDETPDVPRDAEGQ